MVDVLSRLSFENASFVVLDMLVSSICRQVVLLMVSHCGVNLFEPLTIKQGRKQLKRWVVLFTCLTLCCVHLEVVESIDTDAFINSLRRFTNRRGCPKFMYSDCGSNFKGTTSELDDVIATLDCGKIEQYACRDTYRDYELFV